MTRPSVVHVDPSPGDVALGEVLKRLRAERAQPLPTRHGIAPALAAVDDSPAMTTARRKLLDREVAEYDREHPGERPGRRTQGGTT